MRIPLVPSLVRLGIFLFWAAIIAFFLMLPTITQRFKQERSLTIFSWPLLLDPIFLKQFEQETGIKLYITYFENGPALLSKVAATHGNGYDIIIPDDHSLELLIQQNLVKKIDHSRLTFWQDLNPILLNMYADPANEYSIPYYWGVYGIGYDQDLFKNGSPPAKWSTLFDSKICPSTRVCMTDDPREAILLTAQYLFGSIDALKDKDARQQVKNALIKQKKQVEVYTISRSDNLLQSKSCGLAAIMSPEVARLHKEHPNITMLIPEEGSFVVIDSMAIPKSTRKDEMIYQFLNYLFRKEVVAHHVESFGYCSPLITLAPEQTEFCPFDRFKTFDFFRNVISDDEINALWIEVLAA
jgi:spermidine/putrescine transport system substrate-binding protein